MAIGKALRVEGGKYVGFPAKKPDEGWTLLKTFTAINQTATIPEDATELRFVVKSTDTLISDDVYKVSDVLGISYTLVGKCYYNTNNNNYYEVIPTFSHTSNILNLAVVFTSMQTFGSVELYYK